MIEQDLKEILAKIDQKIDKLNGLDKRMEFKRMEFQQFINRGVLFAILGGLAKIFVFFANS